MVLIVSIVDVPVNNAAKIEENTLVAEISIGVFHAIQYPDRQNIMMIPITIPIIKHTAM